MREYCFTLSSPLQLPNRVNLGRSWQAAAGARAAARKALSLEVMAAVGPRGEPMQYVEVLVWRHGIQAPDRDNCYAALKGLLDVLQPSGPKRVYGLGIIRDDSHQRCFAQILHVQARRRADQCTRVVVRETDAAGIAKRLAQEAA
jgi:hypothetical protein